MPDFKKKRQKEGFITSSPEPVSKRPSLNASPVACSLSSRPSFLKSTEVNAGEDFFVSYHFEREADLMPREYYSKHPKITPSARAMLVAWMMECCVQLKAHRSTLHLCVYLLDRFMSLTSLPITNEDTFHSIGAACILIACKYEEIEHPYITWFDALDLGKWEVRVLMTLRWHLNFYTSCSWLEEAMSMSAVNKVLARSLVDCCLMDPRLVGFAPSQIALSIIDLLTAQINKENASPFVEVTGVQEILLDIQQAYPFLFIFPDGEAKGTAHILDEIDLLMEVFVHS